MTANPPVAGERPALADGPLGFNPRFPCLDGLRAIAACAVLVHHVSSATGTNTSSWPGWFFARMDAGVPIFFLLSGFLLYRPFVVAHFEDRPRPGILPFFWRRALRILPAYWLALTGAWLLLGTVRFSDVGDALWSYGLVQIYSKAHVLDGLVQAWSLCTEVAFYVFLPFFAASLRALVARAGVRGRSRLAVELAAVAGLWCIGIGVHGWLLATRSAATPATLWLPAQLDLFALGMVLAVVSAWSAHRGRVPSVFAFAGRHPVVCWLVAGVCFTISALALDLPRVFGDLTGRQEMSRQLLYAGTAFFLLLPAVFGVQDRGYVRRFLRAGVVVWLGLVSYGIYLWHKDLINWWVEHGALDRVPSGRFLTLLALTFVSTVVVAGASWYGLERPILRFKRWVPVTGRSRGRT